MKKRKEEGAERRNRKVRMWGKEAEEGKEEGRE